MVDYITMAAANEFHIRVLIIADYSTCIKNSINNVLCNTIDLDILPYIFFKLSRDHYNAVSSSAATSFSASTALFSRFPTISIEQYLTPTLYSTNGSLYISASMLSLSSPNLTSFEVTMSLSSTLNISLRSALGAFATSSTALNTTSVDKCLTIFGQRHTILPVTYLRPTQGLCISIAIAKVY